jgi:protoporphyrinogen oxidase
LDVAAEDQTIILGGGPTGLSAAYHLDGDWVLLEGAPHLGGWAKSIVADGFTFDYAGHIIFTNDDYAKELFNLFLGDNIHYQQREAWIYSKDTFTLYPYQGNTFGLPDEVLQENILGAVQAYLKYPDDYKPKHFRDWMDTFGEGIANNFLVPYNKKLWKGVPLEEISVDWLGGRVPQPSVEQIIDGAINIPKKNMGPNAYFGYPLRGGFNAIMEGLIGRLGDSGPLLTDKRVTGVRVRDKVVEVNNGAEEHRYETLINTMSLPHFIGICDKVPQSIKDAAARLRWISIQCVNIGIENNRTDKHWIYYPQDDTIFHRIFVQGNASPYCKPHPATSGYTAEISYIPGQPRPQDALGEQGLIDRVVRDLEHVGLKQPGDAVLHASVVDMPVAYVVYEENRKPTVQLIKVWLEDHGIHTAGRFGDWEYYNTDHSLLAGKRVADTVNNAMSQTAQAERKQSAAERVRAQMEAAGITTNHADEWAKVAAAHKS